MVELQDVSFSYTKEVGTLTHVDLTIRPGECVLLCGASGCGKTTITKLVNGLIPAFTEDCTLTGQVLLHGAPVREQPLYQLARQVGSVFQNPKSQFFNMDSDSELAFGLENQGMTRGEILHRLDDTTDRLHLKRLRGRNIFAMSGGEKQLLAFASVYAMGPKLYILDEPTANLDRETIERLHDQIAYLKSRGHTILIAEHRLYFLADLIDRAVYLRDGIVERIWSGAEFRRLAETERIALGLRTLTPTQVTLPPSRAAGEQDGLSVEGLSCRYKREPPVFQNLSFSARPGEVLAVTGDNGVGKSTLSRCLCGLMRESAGTIRLNGRMHHRRRSFRLGSQRRAHHRILPGYIRFQSPMKTASQGCLCFGIQRRDDVRYLQLHRLGLVKQVPGGGVQFVGQFKQSHVGRNQERDGMDAGVPPRRTASAAAQTARAASSVSVV